MHELSSANMHASSSAVELRENARLCEFSGGEGGGISGVQTEVREVQFGTGCGSGAGGGGGGVSGAGWSSGKGGGRGGEKDGGRDSSMVRGYGEGGEGGGEGGVVFGSSVGGVHVLHLCSHVLLRWHIAVALSRCRTHSALKMLARTFCQVARWWFGRWVCAVGVRRALAEGVRHVDRAAQKRLEQLQLGHAMTILAVKAAHTRDTCSLLHITVRAISRQRQRAVLKTVFRQLHLMMRWRAKRQRDESLALALATRQIVAHLAAGFAQFRIALGRGRRRRREERVLWGYAWRRQWVCIGGAVEEWRQLVSFRRCLRACNVRVVQMMERRRVRASKGLALGALRAVAETSRSRRRECDHMAARCALKEKRGRLEAWCHFCRLQLCQHKQHKKVAFQDAALTAATGGGDQAEEEEEEEEFKDSCIFEKGSMPVLPRGPRLPEGCSDTANVWCSKCFCSVCVCRRGTEVRLRMAFRLWSIHTPGFRRSEVAYGLRCAHLLSRTIWLWAHMSTSSCTEPSSKPPTMVRWSTLRAPVVARGVLAWAARAGYLRQAFDKWREWAAPFIQIRRQAGELAGRWRMDLAAEAWRQMSGLSSAGYADPRQLLKRKLKFWYKLACEGVGASSKSIGESLLHVHNHANVHKASTEGAKGLRAEEAEERGAGGGDKGSHKTNATYSSQHRSFGLDQQLRAIAHGPCGPVRLQAVTERLESETLSLEGPKCDALLRQLYCQRVDASEILAAQFKKACDERQSPPQHKNLALPHQLRGGQRRAVTVAAVHRDRSRETADDVNHTGRAAIRGRPPTHSHNAFSTRGSGNSDSVLLPLSSPMTHTDVMSCSQGACPFPTPSTPASHQQGPWQEEGSGQHRGDGQGAVGGGSWKLERSATAERKEAAERRQGGVNASREDRTEMWRAEERRASKTDLSSSSSDSLELEDLPGHQ